MRPAPLLVVGEALGGERPDGMLITTKVELPDDEPAALERKVEESLRASKERLGVEHIDLLLLLHSQLRPDGGPSAPRLLSVDLFREVVRPAFRAVAAGSLADSLDRAVEPDHPAARDYAAAERFRRLAAELGESAARLAHRYALSMPDLSTVVLGVKNRAELEECLAAEAAGPLAHDEFAAVDALRAA